jgi:hypothetical protein
MAAIGAVAGLCRIDKNIIVPNPSPGSARPPIQGARTIDRSPAKINPQLKESIAP